MRYSVDVTARIGFLGVGRCDALDSGSISQWKALTLVSVKEDDQPFRKVTLPDSPRNRRLGYLYAVAVEPDPRSLLRGPWTQTEAVSAWWTAR